MLAVGVALTEHNKLDLSSGSKEKRVKAMLVLSLLSENMTKMDLDTIVTDAALRECFGYKIPKEKVPWTRGGNRRRHSRERLLGLQN